MRSVDFLISTLEMTSRRRIVYRNEIVDFVGTWIELQVHVNIWDFDENEDS